VTHHIDTHKHIHSFIHSILFCKRHDRERTMYKNRQCTKTISSFDTAHKQRNYNQKDGWSVQRTERGVYAIWGHIIVPRYVDSGGRNACNMWFENVEVLVKSSSSAAEHRSSNVGKSDGTTDVRNPDLFARLTNDASIQSISTFYCKYKYYTLVRMKSSCSD